MLNNIFDFIINFPKNNINCYKIMIKFFFLFNKESEKKNDKILLVYKIFYNVKIIKVERTMK